jgi:hypothetical protein
MYEIYSINNHKKNYSEKKMHFFTKIYIPSKSYRVTEYICIYMYIYTWGENQLS